MASPNEHYMHGNAEVQMAEVDMKKRHEEIGNLLDQMEQLWQSKMENEKKFHRLQSALQTMHQQAQHCQGASPEFIHCTQQHQELYEKIVRATHVAQILEQKATKALESCILACEQLCVAADSALQQWKCRQKSQQYGTFVESTRLNEIIKKFQDAMEHAFASWRLINRLYTFHTQSSRGQAGIGQLDEMLRSLYQRAQMICVRILHTSFVITVQPPMVVKNKISPEVSLLAAIDKLGLETQSVQMSARIISEETATELWANPKLLDQKIPTVGHIDGVNVKTKQLQRLGRSTLGFELKNIKITVESRKQAAKCGDAIMKKYYFLCTTEITFNSQSFKLRALSLPFMVSVHGTQDADLYARAFWDTAFSKSVDAVPMVGENQVPWRAMAPALEAIFSILTKGERRLTQRDVEYLKYRLLNGRVFGAEEPMVTWYQFYKEKLERIGGDNQDPRKKCAFSFWEWLFRIGDMIQEKSGRDTGVSDMWEERYIEGFISKQDAESRLKQNIEPAMLLRFSDNQLAGLSIVYQDPFTKDINHLAPFKFKEETEKLTLPVMVVNCDEVKDINVIYPDKRRDRIEEMVVVSKRSMEEELDCSAYKPRTLVMTSNGEKVGNKTPLCSPTSPVQFSISSISNATSPQQCSLLQEHSQNHNVGIVTTNQNAIFPSSGYSMPVDMRQFRDTSDMRIWGGQFDNIDDQSMQSILQDLMRSDDEMDTLVQMVQSFETTPGHGQDAQSSGITAHAASTQNQHFEFEML